jgi:hypothetical protein
MICINTQLSRLESNFYEESKIHAILFCRTLRRFYSKGDPGSGEGKGGGGGGLIRSAGGAMGEMEVRHEEEYFYKKQREQLAILKRKMMAEIEAHEKMIQAHKHAIDQKKNHMTKVEMEEDELKEKDI